MCISGAFAFVVNPDVNWASTFSSAPNQYNPFLVNSMRATFILSSVVALSLSLSQLGIANLRLP